MSASDPTAPGKANCGWLPWFLLMVWLGWIVFLAWNSHPYWGVSRIEPAKTVSPPKEAPIR